MITVFHAKFLTHPELVSSAIFDVHSKISILGREDVALHVLNGGCAGKYEYVPVAVIDTDDFDVAFESTNHIDTDWTENSNVIVIENYKSKGYRSTSSGDIFEKDGRFYLVAMVGFKDLTATVGFKEFTA